MSAPGHTLSIVCVSLNEEAHLPCLKQAIDDLERPDHCEVETVLVDGGSKDATVESAKRIGFDQVKELPGANIPACRNQGVRIATGDWIAFLDADCEPTRDWLTRAAPWLTGPLPTLVGWPVRPPEPGTWVQRTWHIHWLFKNDRLAECDGQRVVLRQAFRLLTTRNLLLNRTVFDKVGGFDESLFTGEDTDFALRADGLGIRVVAFPQLQVIHHGEPATLGAFFRQQRWHANRNSYAKIRALGAGNHAPLFTLLFLCMLALAGISLAGSIVCHTAWPLMGLFPFAGLLTGPAVVIAWRAHRPQYVPALMILYAIYGWARSIDRLGLHPDKHSWKSPA